MESEGIGPKDKGGRTHGRMQDMESLPKELLEKVSGGDTYSVCVDYECPYCNAYLLEWYHDRGEYSDFICMQCWREFGIIGNQVIPLSPY